MLYRSVSFIKMRKLKCFLIFYSLLLVNVSIRMNQIIIMFLFTTILCPIINQNIYLLFVWSFFLLFFSARYIFIVRVCTLQYNILIQEFYSHIIVTSGRIEIIFFLSFFFSWSREHARNFQFWWTLRAFRIRMNYRI